MTALKEYQRLESTGLWREKPEAQLRELVVSFGEATLSLSDKNDTAVAHWSLAAIHRLNPGEMPAVYAPGEDGGETLEISDAHMAGAIDKVLAAIGRYTPRPGRLRAVITVSILAALTLVSVYWLPPALARHTARVLPEVARQHIGEQILRHISRLSGESCRGAGGDYALSNLQTRLADPQPGSSITAPSGPGFRKIVVLRSGVLVSQHLPGGIILLNRALVEDHEDPDVTAGFVLAETLRAGAKDPVERMLAHLGIFTGFRLLTTGKIQDDDLRKHAEYLLTRRQVPLADAALLEAFRSAGVRSSPFAYALDPTGEVTLGLIEADPWPGRSREIVLSDGDWIRLQNICGG